MKITTKWLIGCIGAIMVIFGILIIGSGFKLRRIKRNKADIQRISLTNDKYNAVLNTLGKGELELLGFKPVQRSRSKLGSDDSLHSAKNSVSRGDKLELDNSLKSKINGLEQKLETQTNEFWSDFPKKSKFKKNEHRLEYENKRLERAKIISNLQSEIINLKKEAIHDRTSITSGTSSLRGDTLDTLGYNTRTPDRGSFGSDYSFYSARSSFSRRVSENEMKPVKPVEFTNMDSRFYIENNNKLNNIIDDILIAKKKLKDMTHKFDMEYMPEYHHQIYKKSRSKYYEDKRKLEKDAEKIENLIITMEKELGYFERILLKYVFGYKFRN